ncbi:glycosyltransferase family 4 protein [Planctomicrobium piriforme]|uniref:Glycosyltransferase involved in cell wall bisynthesis n=1 Tax=Planctomicrobium piriforme TaxID=1576369 RepID=A0A1I3NL24_9PLAN|nr:glycosyltransferase family 4 protein [Planctomicrobium piriforme]SFJ09889.1 Glycosyltransferase involved in cell wall bisynthesis [Planctomicrobium piriforme]
MNVVHIITRLILGGAQENTLQTCINQHSLHGDQVTLITGPAIGPEGSLMDRASAAGFRIELEPSLVRSIHPWHDWQAYHRLVKVLRNIRPDIVHTHSSKAGILGRMAAKKLNLPVVHTIHGASFHYGQSAVAYRTYVALEKWAAGWTDHFISVADDMSHEYIAAGVAKPEKFTTVYSGFDVEPFLVPPRDPQVLRAELGLAPDDIVVGKIGRLFHLKGHEFVIQAAARIVAANPRVKFLFVGDGILRSQYEQQIADLGLNKHFVFAGLVPPTRIPELMAAMDIVVHTSQWEGLARVLPQALIAGCPVISYDVGGAREVVVNCETGYLLPRDSVDPLIAAIIDLANDPEKRRRYGEQGRARCRDQFRHQTMSRRIGEVYADVLNRRSSSGV